jgi:N-acetylmuramoyl-L-alanine amidase
MLDIDGTIYQTLDLKERAWHAAHANTRSVGIEIANIGAYPPDDEDRTLERWYGVDARGRTRITLPESMGDGGVRTPGFVGRPARSEPVYGLIHGRPLVQYDLTPEQYDSLIKLTATLCTVLPRIRCDYPRDAAGGVLTTVMPEDEWEAYGGLIGHFHLTENKIDPGPAFDWDRVVDGARTLMR